MMVKLPATILRYGVAFAAVLLALFITLNIDFLADRLSFALLFAAIVFATWFGGRGPGVLAIVLSVIGGEYVIIPPHYAFKFSSAALLPLVTFIPLTSLIVLLLSALQERAISLTASETRYRFLFENNPMPMWVFDRETLKFLAVNEAAISHYGYSREEFLSMTLLEIRPAEDHEALKEDVFRKEPGAKSVGTWRHVRKNGSLIDVEITAHELDFEGKPSRLVLASNITERKRAETLLRESEERLQKIIENLKEGLIVSDLKGEVLFLNRAALEMFDFSSMEEWRQRHRSEFADVIELSDIDGTVFSLDQWPLARVLRGEEVRDLEMQARKFDGSLARTFSYGGVLIPETEGNAGMAIVTVSDITERKRAARDLLDSERRFRALIEHSGDSISLVNAENEILYLSPAVKAVEGYEPAELVGRNGLENTHPDDMEEVGKVVGQLLARPGEPVPVVWRRKHKQGHWIWLEGVATNLLDDPAIGGIVTNYRDISERRKAEAEIQQLNVTLENRVIERTAELEAANSELIKSRAVFENLFESLPGLYLVMTPELKIVTASDAYLEATMTKREEITGCDLFDVFPDNPDDPAATGVSNLRASLDRVRKHAAPDIMAIQKYDVQRPDGAFEEHYWSPINSPVFGADRKIEYIVHRVEKVTDFVKQKPSPAEENDGADLNARMEQMEAEIFLSSQKIQAINRQLEVANKELESFSYSVSHDLRAPLRHINGFSLALLEDYSDRLDETGKGYLNEVREASQEMAQLIDDVLQLARVTRSEMHRERVDISELAEDVVRSIRKRAAAERTVDVTIEKGLVTHGDKRLLGIVLTNLFENSWKFTAKREIAEISFGMNSANGKTGFFVRDNGAGFDMAYADKLYGAFQRLHSTKEFEGTGIGLATVQRIISRHGGSVWAEGELERGATFYFSLPEHTEILNER